MFFGSIPSSIYPIITETVREWGCKEVYVGCSGNFTIERLLHKTNKIDVHGNDVTIYSCALGDYFSGLGLNEYQLKEVENLEWLQDYVKTDEDKLATILLCSNAATYLLRADNEYGKRMQRAYTEQWKTLHEKTTQKIKEQTFKLKSYFAGDVVEYQKNIPPEAGFITYPPFFAGDYEKMFKAMEVIFDWPEPEYEMMEAEGAARLFKDISSMGSPWMFGTNQELPAYADYLIAKAQTTNRGVPIFVYGLKHGKKNISPHQDIKSVTIPRLTPGKEIGSTILLQQLTGEEFRALRSQYMNINILPGEASLAYAVTVDGLIIGIFAITPPNKYSYSGGVREPYVYMLSDFPVEPSDYPRLAKLVLYAALSKETKHLTERMMGKRVYTIITTAFTDNPVSMKYRGVLELISRKEKKQNKKEDIAENYYSQKYELNYAGLLGQWTLQEGLEIWKEKHGERITSEN